VLCNSLGRYEDALAAAQRASEDSPADLFANWAVAELIEAATRSGASERAAGALQRLSATARASGTDWALGVEARSRALASDGETAETLYREAIDRLGRTRLQVELGRAHLLYGEWLRRGTAALTPASNCAPPTRCSPPWEPAGSRNEPRASCAPPASGYANAPPRPLPSSLPARPRSPGWPATA
jgi:hypothetical protein